MSSLKQKLTSELAKVLGEEVLLVAPPRPEMGDWSLPVFALAKKQGQNPVELAKELVSRFKAVKSSALNSAVAAGPYVNFSFPAAELAAEVLAEKICPLKKLKQKIALDVFQANPLKEFHIGHLRNAVLGESIRRLLEWQGYTTATYSYSGDVGIHVAKWLWYYQNFYEGEVSKEHFTHWAGGLYAAAVAKAAEKPEYESEIKEMNQLVDARDKKIIKLWREMTGKSYAASWQIAKELGCRVDYSFPESQCEGPGKKFVQAAIKAGKLKLDQGAWGADLNEWDLGFFILLKSDGTAIYQTKDLGLAILRNKKIGRYAKCLMVVGSEQEYYFHQLFKTFEVLGLPDAGKCQHVPHGLVSLKAGKMSSREGNVISYDELRDKTQEKVLAAINEKNPALKDKEKAARVVADGALKFSLLKVDRTRPVAFDWDEALSFEGNSGPYLQYTYARIRAVERKSLKHKNIKTPLRFASAGQALKQKPNHSLLNNAEGVRVIKIFGGFAEAVAKAAGEYQPYILANYLLNLSAEFNHFYHECRVVDAEQPAVSQARLALVGKVAEVLKAGLEILGIGVVEEM
ncbi:MAG: arginine--tRNA ligase [Patescibacteria group bacterium]|jgi:arginyl-tRNA synthetase